jgi:hypothetical protein
MTMVSHDRARVAKVHGQQLSIDDLLIDHETAFMRIVVALKPGTDLTFNSIRESVDAAKIPAKQRAGLMRRACADGLLEPVMLTVMGQAIHAKVPSTGATAHGAHVAVYRRSGYQPGVTA